MQNILFFSNNAAKVKEIKYLFNSIKLNILSLEDFDVALEPKEVGRSFAENAKIKSLCGYNKTKTPSFADDSGICIEALKWGPNIFSKRFINSFKNNHDCFKYIINIVEKTGNDRAYFQTSICYTVASNYHIVFEGRVFGKISKRIIGSRGFGFDPIFIPNGFRKTFGQMSTSEKNFLSHRSVAINKLIGFLIN